MALNVGKKPLRRRRDQLRSGADTLDSANDPATVCLLLFYAAECGLKERVLHRRGHGDTSALDPSHDLRGLAKELRLPRSVWNHLERLQRCRLHTPHRRNTVNLPELHQAWRYGARMHEIDQKEADAALRALISWCERD